MQSNNSTKPDLCCNRGSFNSEEGLLTLHGTSIELRRRLDALFLSWAGLVGAEEYSFPPVLPVLSLDLADYFTSFPHLATLVAQIDRDDDSMKNLFYSAQRQSLSEINKKHLAPVRYVLPSAACYAVYDYLRGKHLKNDIYITIVASCFRHEDHYNAFERQWAFTMREIICIGQPESVQRCLDTYRDLLTGKLEKAGLPFNICMATDPFFDKRDPALLMQRIKPTKHEILYRDRLAISSLNFHRDFFGERYGILDQNGESAFSGCIAFGLERWLYSCIQEYGQNWNNWPAVLKPSSPLETM